MVNAIGAAGATTPALQRAAVTREQFLQILVTELTSQNPLDPLDNSKFLDQLVGLQSLEQSAALTDGLRSFEKFLQMSSAATLIGKKVKGLSEGGAAVQGTVEKVVLEKDKVQLVIGNQKLPVASVTEILPG